MREKVYTVGFMMVVAAAFTAGVSFAKRMTQDEIRMNEEVRQQQAVLSVLGLLPERPAAPQAVMDLYSRRVVKRALGDLTVYTGYAGDDRKDVIGYAFPVGGMGLWSGIEGLLALDPTLTTIVGLEFTKQGETPGLGARITEAWFKNQFKGKSAAQKDATGRYIRVVASDKLTQANEIHGITGATITTNSVASFLNTGIERIRETMKAQTP